MNRSLAVVWSFLLLVSLFPIATQACSCIRRSFGQMFQEAQYVDTVYILGLVEVKDGYFNGWANRTSMEPSDNSMYDPFEIYYLAFQKRSNKGCKHRPGRFIIYKTASDSAMCGVSYLQPGWYILGSGLSSSDKLPFKSINSCGLVVSTKDLTSSQKVYLNRNSAKCQSYV